MNTAEKHFALREGHHNAAAEAYFDARPEQDLPLGRKTFKAGFVRAFDLLTTPRRGEARRLSEHEWKLIASLCSLQRVADALFITGPKLQSWGFRTEHGVIPWREYLGVA